MSADLVGQLFFEGGSGTPNPYGWTETYWMAGNDYTAAGGNLNQIAVARLALAPSSIQVVRARVSDMNVRGDAYVVPLSITSGSWPTLSDFPCEAWTALLLRKRSGFVYFSNLFLHGIPESQITNAVYAPNAAFNAAMTTFITTVIADAQMRVNNKVPPPVGKIRVPISAISPERLTEHKVGRPFGQLRGRRSIA